MHNLELILTLTAGLGFALALGLLAHRMRLPPIVGYLIAGLLLGPYTPGLVIDRAVAAQLAEVGVILLMFGVGLQFHVKDLLAVRRIAISGALCQIAVATLLGALATRGLGWSWPASLSFGVALSVASTVVLIRVLSDHHDLENHAGRVAIGWLVVEDIFTVFVLVLMAAIFGENRPDSAGWPIVVGVSMLKLGALAALVLVGGSRYIPRLLAIVARTRSRELFTLAVLVIALGVAVGAAKVFGVSMALGAFLAGMVVGQSEFSYRAASEALPMRDAFAVLFFVSVGMLFDPAQLVRAPALSMLAFGIVLLAKPLAALVIVVAFGHGARIGLRVAIALAQIGEFSFIVATLGDQLGILPGGATDAIVAAAIISITLNPLLYRLIPAVEHWLDARPSLRRILAPRRGAQIDRQPAPSSETGRYAIVVGYGPVGESVSRLLAVHGIEARIVELNFETVQRLKREGIPAIYGDASHADILKEAGAAGALALILSSRSSAAAAGIVHNARSLNPGILVLVRSGFLSDARALRQAGADDVFSGEAEVAIAMIDSLLRKLGATPEEVESERNRIRLELYKPADE